MKSIEIMKKEQMNSNRLQLPEPIDEIGGYRVRPGNYAVYGAMAVPGGVNFTIHTRKADSVELLLFHRKETEPYAVLPFPDCYRIGHVYSMIVFDLDIGDFEYAYRLDGPWDPQRGLRFSGENVLLDIYAKAVTGQSVWGKKQAEDSFYKARVVMDNFDWGKDKNPQIPMEDLVIYELHVRGFTKHPSSGVSHPGTFSGIIEKIPYLKELGVNAVELMPVFEFDEVKDDRSYQGRQLLDYWGYNPVSFFAPNTGYAGETEYNHEGYELKTMIRALNENGIECFLDVVFNHTAEGNEDGPVISFKGFDNEIYYMLTPDGYYYNYSGCGNTLNCNHPVVRQMIMDCLRYWTSAYHVDGFRFDLASILGRNQDGTPMNHPPLLESLANDPVLGDVKLIAEAWDAGGLYQVGSFPAWKRWAEWNGRYRDDMRDYLKGDCGLSHTAALRITGSRDIYNPLYRGENASVNFLNCHDGFTLWDMYSYNEKHNEANGWDNTDGSNDNRSWNCGAEGETDEEEVLGLRRKLAKNALTVLMMSRGTPMFFAGDEFLNTQFGNNNAYCQDNEISWLDWTYQEKNREHFIYTKHIIRLRREHDVIRKFSGNCSFGLPEIQVREPDERTKVLCVTYAGRPDGRDDAVCLAVNVYWERQICILPELPGNGPVGTDHSEAAQEFPEIGSGGCTPGVFRWRIEADSSGRYLAEGIPSEADPFFVEGTEIEMEPRSVLVFVMQKIIEEKAGQTEKVTDRI